MKCKVYFSNKKNTRYLIIAETAEISQLPTDINEEFSTADFFKSIELDNRQRIGLNVAKTMAEIEKNSFQVVEIGTLFDEKG